MGKHDRISANARVARHRAAMRAQGLRLKQMWVPDVRSPQFREEARRQSRRVAQQVSRNADIVLAESLQHWPDGDV